MKTVKSGKSVLQRVVLPLALILTAAIILSRYFHRFDLTTEKRYTLSAYTRQILRELKDIVYVKVYLNGDLNIPLRKMRQSIKETLDEFRVYAGDNLEYEFINPFADGDPAKQEDVVRELYDRGLTPMNIISGDEEGGSAEKIVFPGALVNYRGTEAALNLLKDNQETGAEEDINNSIQALEFELIRLISSLSADTTEKIAFLEGQGELDEFQVGDLTRELGWYFQVDRGEIRGRPGALDAYEAVIVAKPTLPFEEQDKFVLDQYIMHGGKVLWFLDLVQVSLDSINDNGMTPALIRELNVEDMLFRYGIRINPVLLQDIQCNIIPVNMALAGNNANFQPASWLYYPLLTAPPGHPVTRNLNLIRTEFPSDIDTVGSGKSLQKTVLLHTSEYTRHLDAPAIVSLDEVAREIRPEQFNEKNRPVAVLLEGTFESLYRNRMVSEMFPSLSVPVAGSSVETSMLVVSDGDVIRNDARQTAQGMLVSPLGYDRYTQQTFGNREFAVNVILYMTGHRDLINLRSRELALRLLDKAELREHRLRIVLLNTLIPPALVLAGGLLAGWMRKRRFSKPV